MTANGVGRDDTTTTGRGRATPLRAFLATESGSALLLVASIAAALVWANLNNASYESFWGTTFALRLGSAEISLDLREWVNRGLMTLFFLVVGLEARRELDLGDLRERRRFILPCLAGLAGMVVPVGIYLAVNHGGSASHGWGVAMSTDTALALGLLALLGRDIPDRMRAFMLTVFVIDDLVALAVIAVVYSRDISVAPLLLAVGAFVLLLVAVRLRLRQRVVFVVLGIGLWAALSSSGVDPVVTGLAIGLAAPAYTPTTDDLQRVTGRFRRFREEPTPALARSARASLVGALSPNERLQSFYHPWTSYVIVPVFALANAGLVLDRDFLVAAYTSPITLGIIVGYVVGKPVAVAGVSWVVTRVTGGRIRPPVGAAAVLASGTIAGIGFTVALLIASRAFTGTDLDQAKLGALSAAALSALATWVVFRVTARFDPVRRARLMLGDSTLIQDLVPAVDPDRDHIRGPRRSPMTVIEFGDFECPHCGFAETGVRELLTDTHIRYVWRHLPLVDVHPRAQMAAEASEAAAEQGAFWPMHDRLLEHQDALSSDDLIDHATALGLDIPRFRADLESGEMSARIARDVESADLSGVSGTPTFFVNGQRHHGSYDIAALTAAVATEKRRLDAATT